MTMCLAAWLPAFVYLKHVGKQCLRLVAYTWGSDHIDLKNARKKTPLFQVVYKILMTRGIR
jgi:hypothetical protein